MNASEAASGARSVGPTRVGLPGADVLRSDLVRSDLVRAGRALARDGLVTAFGHVSARLGDGATLLVTPPQPLGTVSGAECLHLPVEGDTLPEGVPAEAWIHRAIAAARPDVGAICRAQPFHTNAATAVGAAIRPLHGQGALLGGPTPVFDEARLVRDRTRAADLAACLGGAHSLVMRGNGAVTTGRTVGEAVARMWILEESARLAVASAAAGTSRPLTEAEQHAWQGAGPELLGRIWTHLTSTAGAALTSPAGTPSPSEQTP
ncbi:class II aldolase/adducin family protein [Streptomyces sp. NPDC088387]|uniref:class II aldolase/adducin family protein n=1 Tax=Streptomyces sp. NPDC088387 TaxID=3365859 RepID=UPI00382443CC